MLPIQPKFSSATPMMRFTGRLHHAFLMSHIQGTGPVQYDSILMVNRIGVDEYCLIVTLETEAPGQPLKLVVYAEKGRQELSFKNSKPTDRQGFLPAAFFVVQALLQDRLQPFLPSQAKMAVEEKPLREFYPDSKQRLKLHYHFAHRWLPAYVRSDPARFFGYFQRGEQEPTKFIQARWQMMETESKLIAPSLPGHAETVIRRVNDLHMWVEFPPLDGQSEHSVVQYPIAVVQMPQPEFVTHAYFVGVVLVPGQPAEVEPAKTKVHVFTLEKIERSTTDGRLCEWAVATNEITHCNYGTQVPATREDFIKSALVKVRDPNRVLVASTSIRIGNPGQMSKS